MDEMLAGALFCSRLRGKSRGAGKGERFSFAPKARLYGFPPPKGRLYGFTSTLVH
jgi:hypothetical protein